jgi:hypothetical protein
MQLQNSKSSLRTTPPIMSGSFGKLPVGLTEDSVSELMDRLIAEHHQREEVSSLAEKNLARGGEKSLPIVRG